MLRVLLSFLIFLVFHGAHAQFCVPEDVGPLSLDLNYVLHWNASTNCDETHYLIYIHIEDNLQYIYNTDDLFLDVSFLPACETFHFLVRAFSNHQLSDERRLEAYMPAPSGTNLTITAFNITRQGRGLYLNWTVDEKFAHCARAFRVVIRDDWFVPRDVYTQTNNLYLDDLVPCAYYEFTVTAIYNQQSEGPIVLQRYIAPDERAGLPRLKQVTVGSTDANLTYTVDSYAVNRCPINALFISGQFYSKTYQVQDTPARPDITVNLAPLQANSMYVLNVAVVNSAGTSDPLPIGIQTLPA